MVTINVFQYGGMIFNYLFIIWYLPMNFCRRRNIQMLSYQNKKSYPKGKTILMNILSLW